MGFKKAIIWSKYQSKVTIQAPNQYSDYLIDPSFQGVNRTFALLFEFNADRTIHTKYHFPTVEIKDYNVMTEEKNFYHQTVKNNLIYDNIRKITTSPGDDYTTSCILDYNYFNKYYKIIEKKLSNQ